MEVVRTDRWYTKWFNDEYLALYSNHDAAEARSAIELIRSRLPFVPPGITLDLGCGAGRHLAFLNGQQPTIGLDLSPWLLEVARHKARATPLVRADMRRLPFRDRAFTLIVNLFTSFGYFADDAENRGVLGEVARVTAPGGWLVLDYLNAPYTRGSVVPFDGRRVGPFWVQQEREMSSDGRFIKKTIRLVERDTVFTERVRLFEPHELVAMLVEREYAIANVYGDYQGTPLSDKSPRAIIIAERRDAR
jgi:SAM-dependent methyltransferase